MAHSHIRPPRAARPSFFAIGFREDETSCNVHIRVGDVTFLGHSLILTASSGYFRGELGLGDTPIEDKVVLTDVNVSAFREIVHFIYTGSLRTSKIEDFYDLLRTYDVLKVRYPIEDQLVAGVEAIDKENKLIRNAFSLLYHAEDTKRTTLTEFMRKHVLKHVEHFFLEDDDFLEISYSHLKEIVERRYLLPGQEVLLKDGIERWLYHEPKERMEYFEPLLSWVNFDEELE